MKKHILILGGGGFIGGHLAKRLKSEGNYVRIADIKPHDYFRNSDICDQFMIGDLTNTIFANNVMFAPNMRDVNDEINSFDEVYQLAADMGGAGYIFTGNNDANVMHNSAMINLNVAHAAVRFRVKKVFYSSSACMYPEHNQLDPNNPNCEESSAYPANPDSEYGWEKLFSERLYMAFARNHGLDVRIARFHNIFGTDGTWQGGKEKAPAAVCRKVAEAKNGGEIEIWGDGTQTRSFLYVDDCVDAVIMLMRNSDYCHPVNIGSEEMVSMNELARMVIEISTKDISVKNIYGEEFEKKYGHKCPLGVKGRNSDNKLFRMVVGADNYMSLKEGIAKLYSWINTKVHNEENNTLRSLL